MRVVLKDVIPTEHVAVYPAIEKGMAAAGTPGEDLKWSGSSGSLCGKIAS